MSPIIMKCLYKIPKTKDAAALTLEEAKELMEAQDAAPKKPARRKRQSN